MKKTILIPILLLSFLFYSVPCSAESQERMPNEASPDYAEILSLEGDIVERIGRIHHAETGLEPPADLAPDFSDAVKIYVDTNVFSLDTSDTAAVKQALDDGEYIWLLPITLDSKQYQVNIAKGSPLDESLIGKKDPSGNPVLTDSEIEQIKREEGKWVVSGVDIPEQPMDYHAIIENKLSQLGLDGSPDVVLVGGLPGFLMPVGLAMNQQAEYLVPIYPEQFELSNTALNARVPKQQDSVYRYEEIREYLNTMDFTDAETGGAGGVTPENDDNSPVDSPVLSIVLILAGAAALLTAVVLFLTTRKK